MKRRSLLAVPLLLSTTPAWAAPAKPVAKPRPKLIALDPGHGGTDPGALGANGVQEKNVVITVARELQAQLQAGGRYRVMLTRASDTYVRGASIYTLSEEASDREAAALAARENGGPSVQASGTVARTLVAMAQR